MWEIKEIDATTFNVVSDLVALLAASLLLAVLSSVYPQMVYTLVKRGTGVDLDGVTRPPISFWDATWQFVRGHSSRLFILAVLMISIVATFSHAVADAFLEFKVVELGGSNQVCVDRVYAAFYLGVCLSITIPLTDSFSWLDTSWCTHLQANG